MGKKRRARHRGEGAVRPAGHESDRGRGTGDIAAVDRYAAVADRLLFDARAPREATRPGGLGKPFDWRLLGELDPGIPFMLSGGLDAGNVAQALSITRAPGVDVSSGVERAPGEKDSDKIRAFVRPRGRRRPSAAKCEYRMTIAATEFLPHRAGRARPFRHLWRPVCRRDADAADSGARAGLCRGQGRSGFKGDGRLSDALRRPAVAALFCRAAHDIADRRPPPFGGGAKIYLKREELNHTGAHKVNNVLGQIMLARRMGKKRIIAETGAGKHGVATATFARASGSTASSIWARSMSSGKSRTCFA